MPIGVPRIIYCWGEEVPAQWTDIYNFIFRRRMVFLMQYLDDELCNQICGLLINIHMEDRSKELEKKEMEKSGLFKNKLESASAATSGSRTSSGANLENKMQKNVEDLLLSEQDLAIEDNHTLEQYTLQKITMQWLTWNAQFFNYEDEPYFYYLAEILCKDFNKQNGRLIYNLEMTRLMKMFKTMCGVSSKINSTITLKTTPSHNALYPGDMNKFIDSECTAQMPIRTRRLAEGKAVKKSRTESGALATLNKTGKKHFDVYSPFRLIANFSSGKYSFNQLFPASSSIPKQLSSSSSTSSSADANINHKIQAQPEKSSTHSIISGSSIDFTQRVNLNVGKKDFFAKAHNVAAQIKVSEKSLSEKFLKTQYRKSHSQTSSKPFGALGVLSKSKLITSIPQNLIGRAKNDAKANYLNFNSFTDQNFGDYNSFYRKQTERTLQEEESKKVFVIINSFGGSVGNGITVHDALQFIKAGSLTLALGVAASAASLALAGGTIGERYVTEGCHVMIHQPESGLNGQASDIWIDSQEIMKIRLDVAEIYSLSTYRPRHKILRDLDRDFYLTAMETINYGLADEIATNEVMHEIIEMTSKVWGYDDNKQQRLLESRESASSGLDTEIQN